MLNKNAKLLLIVSTLLLCLIGGASVLTRYQKMTNCYGYRPSLKSIGITINPNQSQQLIEQLQKFANQNSLNTKTAYYSQNNEDFSVWMKRKDVEVVIRSPFILGRFEIDFYNNDCIHPTISSDIDDLVSDLKRLLSEIPNIIVSEEN